MRQPVNGEHTSRRMVRLRLHYCYRVTLKRITPRHVLRALVNVSFQARYRGMGSVANLDHYLLPVPESQISTLILDHVSSDDLLKNFKHTSVCACMIVYSYIYIYIYTGIAGAMNRILSS